MMVILKHIKRLICLVFAVYCGVLAAEEVVDKTIEIISGEALYQDREITLTGDIKVKYFLGEITAKRALIGSSANQEKKRSFSHISLEDDIEIKLTNGGVISCQKAEIDSTTQTGEFWGSPKRPNVIYSIEGDSIQAEQVIYDLAHHLLILKRCRGELSFSAESHMAEKVQFRAKEVVWDMNHNLVDFKQDVWISYNQISQIQTDQMLALKYKNQNGKRTLLSLTGDSNTTLDHQGTSCSQHYHFYCPGQFIMDHESREIHLKGNNEQRVVFYDKINQIQMSGLALIIQIDSETKKERVQGIGDVRFKFLDRELNHSPYEKDANE